MILIGLLFLTWDARSNIIFYNSFAHKKMNVPNDQKVTMLWNNIDKIDIQNKSYIQWHFIWYCRP